MPLASKVVKVQGHKLLDGGVSDSIPLQYFESIGYKRNVVILTQPLGYQKEHNRLMALMRTRCITISWNMWPTPNDWAAVW